MDSSVKELVDLHYEFRKLIESGQWKKVNKRLREIRFAHNVNKSKTVLILTQSLVNNPHILEERYELYKSFNEDIGHVWAKWPINIANDPNVPEKYKNNNK